MQTGSSFSAERIADRMEIEDVLHRWCRAIDRYDLERIPALFHEDAIDQHGAFVGGVDGLVDWIRTKHRGIPFSAHLISNLLIEFAGPDVALCECYVSHVQRFSPDAVVYLTAATGGRPMREGASADLFGVSRYVDRFERRDGGAWRIAHRTVIAGWRAAHEVPPNPTGAPPNQDVQRRDQDDYVFHARKALGLP